MVDRRVRAKRRLAPALMALAVALLLEVVLDGISAGRDGVPATRVGGTGQIRGVRAGARTHAGLGPGSL